MATDVFSDRELLAVSKAEVERVKADYHRNVRTLCDVMSDMRREIADLREKLVKAERVSK